MLKMGLVAAVLEPDVQQQQAEEDVQALDEVLASVNETIQEQSDDLKAALED